MRGGMTFFRGSTADAARRYLEKDRTVAADYYTEQGRILATNYGFRPDGSLSTVNALTAEAYGLLMDGKDPETGAQRGRAMNEKSLRFIDKIINVSKDLSLAAELDDDVSEALDRAMSEASMGLGVYLAQNTHVRIRVDGGRLWVTPDEIQVATVVHRTSRDGDPHRHIHFQIVNKARVGDTWYAFDTQELRGLNRTLNMLGERVIHSDANLLRVLEEKGFTFDPQTGDIVELNPFAESFSKRATAIAERRAEIIADWEEKHPGEELGRDLLNAIDHQAWAQTRAEKATETYADEMSWASELEAMGYVAPALGEAKHHYNVLQVAEKARHDYAVEVVEELSTKYSTWSRAEITATIYERLGKYELVGTHRELSEFAQDVLERSETLCVGVLPYVDPKMLPAFVNAYTSETVLEDEEKLRVVYAELGATHAPVKMFRNGKVSRVQGALSVEEIREFFKIYQAQHPGEEIILPSSVEHWDALCHAAGSERLTGIIGPAGAGKTTLMKALRVLTEAQGGSLHVVAPSGKAALGAQEETGAHGSTLHKLLMAYGFSFETDEETGVTTWGERDRSKPVPAEWLLSANDVLMVDEAGMMTQDVALRLNEIVRETGVRLRQTGDHRQLAAVGRGGILEMTQQHASSTDLRDIFRFKTAEGVLDKDYAELSLQIRLGQDPRAVFDELLKRGHIVLHESEEDAHKALSEEWVKSYEAGESCVIATATNADVTSINALTAQARQNLGIDPWDGESKDVLTGRDGLTIHVGDVISTRKNSAELGVLNRQTWQVKSIDETHILVESTEDTAHRVTLPLDYVGENVEIAYAITGHGSQGMTVDKAHVLVTGATDTAGLYVGVSRGRYANQVHFVAEDMDDAFEQFASAMRRDNADRGLAPARESLLKQLGDMGYVPEKPERFETPIRAGDVKPGQILLSGGKRYAVLGVRELESGEVSLHLMTPEQQHWSKALATDKFVGRYIGAGRFPLPDSAKSRIAKLETAFEPMVSARDYVGEVKNWAQAHAGDLFSLKSGTEIISQSEKLITGTEALIRGERERLDMAQDMRKQLLDEPRREYAEAKTAVESMGFFSLGKGKAQARLDEAKNHLVKVMEANPEPVADKRLEQWESELATYQKHRDLNQDWMDKKYQELAESMPVIAGSAQKYVTGAGLGTDGSVDVELVEGFEEKFQANVLRRFELSDVAPESRAGALSQYYVEAERAVASRSQVSGVRIESAPEYVAPVYDPEQGGYCIDM